MRMIITLCALLAVTASVYAFVDFDAIARWAAQEQRAFQNRMATAVRALQTGDAGALAALFTAAAAYGFFHAVGPGHGKALIGGVGLGSSVSAARLLTISLVSSLAQAVWAIVLVYGGFALFELSARRMTTLAELYLAPVSYLAIALVGGILVWRGTRDLARAQKTASKPRQPSHQHAHDHHPHHAHAHDHGHDHHHDLHHGHHHDDHCGCHSHGPSPEDVAKLTSWRETVALIASIAIRPCTGAIFLLVIAWQMDLILAGAAAAIIMGLGTATFTSLVAVSSVMARTMTLVSADRLSLVAYFIPGIQILAGAVVVWISLTLLGYTL